MRVLFLLGCNEGPSKRYRIFNHIEALKARGVDAEWLWDIHLQIFDPAYVGRFSIIVDFRSGFNDRVERFFALARRLSIPIVYDIDDLVFDPTLVDEIDAYRLMDEPAQIEYLAGMRSISRAMLASDYYTTSTSFLGQYIEDFARKPCWVVPFGVNDRQVAIAKMTEPMVGSPRFIGYLSGTQTHQRDFAEAAPALRRILAEYDDVFLKLIGYLDIDEHLPGLEHKVIRLDFMDWQDLVIEAKSLYINIAPFEQGSLFCQAKSQLKFVEAGLCGVPTIASPMPSFRDSIESGVNGFIASNDEEWFEAFTVLLDDGALRDRMGRRALQTCRRRHYPKRIGDRLVEVYTEIIKAHASARTGSSYVPVRREAAAGEKSLRITWLIPQPFEGSGGHRNIFRAIRYLSDFGHNCTVHFVLDNHRFENGRDISDFISREFFDLHTDDVILGTTDIEDCDILVCTWWTTAYIARENADRAGSCIYFLQDVEPFFYPMGTDYVRAAETYSFGFHFITSGPWPLQMLRTMRGITEGDWFRFPLDRNIYFPGDDNHRAANRVVFFARPRMPRRCYPLGVEALKLVKQRRPDTEIVFYGDDGEQYKNVPFSFVNLGLTETIQELGDLYRTATVGLCFSTTNPSLVPFEMMASGCPVVDLKTNGNEVNYGSADNAELVDADPARIADGICRVLDDRKGAERLRRNGVEFSKQFPSELEMARLIERFMLAEFNKTNRAEPRRSGEVRALESLT